MIFDLVRELWHALWVLFLLEAVGLVGAGHLLYRRRPQGGKRTTQGLAFLGFWPGDQVIAGWEHPPLPTAEGIFLLRPGSTSAATPYQLESYNFVPWSELRPIESEHDKVICRQLEIRTPSPTHARALAARLHRLREAEPKERQKLLAEERRERLDAQALGKKLETLKPLLRDLRIVCRLGLVVDLLLVPLVAFFTSARGLLIGLLWLALAFHLLLIPLVLRCARRLEAAGWSHPRGVLLPLLLSPPALLRSPTALVRPLATGWDDEALVLALLERNEQEKILRPRLHGIRWAAQKAGDETAARAFRDFWSRHQEALLPRLKNAGIDPEALLAPPAASDPSTRAICPLCGAELREMQESCSDCQGPLIAPAAAAKA